MEYEDLYNIKYVYSNSDDDKINQCSKDYERG